MEAVLDIGCIPSPTAPNLALNVATSWPELFKHGYYTQACSIVNGTGGKCTSRRSPATSPNKYTVKLAGILAARLEEELSERNQFIHIAELLLQQLTPTLLVNAKTMLCDLM